MQKTINAIVEEIVKNQGQRFGNGQSWEFCHAYFIEHKEALRSANDIADEAALHLGFYLANWGMFRGSGQLMRANYLFEKEIVRILLGRRFNSLFAFDWLRADYEAQIELLFDLVGELKRFMKEAELYEDNGDLCHVSATDTLITKIIMGTMGCVPAYDRFFCAGLNMYSGSNCKVPQSFNAKSFGRLLRFSKEDSTLKDIYGAHVRTVKGDVIYTPMKLLDLYFWRIGFASQGTQPIQN
jgi:hypothetical protein